MNKVGKIVVKSLIFLIVLGTFTSIVSADDYHWECMTHGDCLSGGYCCYHDQCLACVKDGYTRLFSHCYDKPMCKYGDNTFDQEPPVITVNAPLDNSVFSSRYVAFDIEIDEPVSLYYLDSAEERRGYMRMCSNCMSYTRPRSFDDGEHTLTFKASDWAGNEGFAETSFVIDSKEPRIRNTYPRSREYVSNEFTVEYDEVNLESITLHYKSANPGDYNEVKKTECLSGKRQTCVFTVDGLPQGELYYYFTVTDVATSVDSRETLVYVDTVDPKITSGLGVQEFYPERRFEFDLHVTEEVTLEYIDYEDTRPRFKRLCSRCTDYTKSKSFNDGFHNLEVRASDNAGNDDIVQMSFTIDSKAPRIKRTEPRRRGYTDGSFTVKYDEENVEEFVLYYKLEEDSENYEGDCPSGKNQECTINVEALKGIPYGELWYYVFIKDNVGHTDESRESMVYVDTVDPEITKADFTLNGRRVNFEIEVDEEVEIGYIDNSDPRLRYRRLCSRCTEYKRSRSFSYDSTHDLTIIATDNAGNTDEASMLITIPPR